MRAGLFKEVKGEIECDFFCRKGDQRQGDVAQERKFEITVIVTGACYQSYQGCCAGKITMQVVGIEDVEGGAE
jgi:hypothetical protein